jgi:hypothetical protein
MTPDLRFYPVTNHRETSTRLPDPEIVHPTPEDGIGDLDQLAPAVRSGETEWSIGKLNDFAERVRAAFDAQGIQPGDVVAVQAERSPLPPPWSTNWLRQSSSCNCAAYWLDGNL